MYISVAIRGFKPNWGKINGRGILLHMGYRFLLFQSERSLRGFVLKKDVFHSGLACTGYFIYKELFFPHRRYW